MRVEANEMMLAGLWNPVTMEAAIYPRKGEVKMSETVTLELGPILEQRLSEIEKRLGIKAESSGKGLIGPASKDERLTKIVEALKSGSIREQWTAPLALPDAPTANIASFVKNYTILRGEPGDVAYIPVVKDFNVSKPTGGVGGTLSEITGAYTYVQTTLTEVGAYMQIPYNDLEKFSEDIVSEIEQKFAKACLRAVDKEILDTVIADTDVPELDKSSAQVYFDADWIPEALHTIGLQNKDVKPQDTILVINTYMYADLFKDVAASQPVVFAMPDVVREGLLAELFGVKILVSNYLPTYATKSYSAFLIHKNAVVYAPKREILIESQKDTVARKVKLTGTHTFGLVLADDKAICEIKTKATP